ncbi:hypothetical protein GTA08_BOTSDO13821 [Botryosphaeria dothidea]|uniref:Uncharacterized protein n=1 Tax=Botryosphaeria dothidea TaxID=55169 RepID=A0A8H4ND04_9PEZI|nr:hypothetical protein GTA08_BOTSDO13821 [Botryosphaeria dothidea]
MSIQQQSLTEWVERLNDDIFYQPKDEVAFKTIEEDVDPNVIVKINHNTYDFAKFKGGVEFVRSTGVMSLDKSEELIRWEDEEKKGGSVALMTRFTFKENATGKVSSKDSLVISTVKWIDGKRKLVELTEVESE